MAAKTSKPTANESRSGEASSPPEPRTLAASDIFAVAVTSNTAANNERIKTQHLALFVHRSCGKTEARPDVWPRGSYQAASGRVESLATDGNKRRKIILPQFVRLQNFVRL
ncbi:MAG: hypothetical protein ACF788_05325 [Novipirellula sp. JB048]